MGQPGQPDVGAVDETLDQGERRLVLPQEVERDRGQDAGESGQRRVGEQAIGQGPQRGLVLVQALHGQRERALMLLSRSTASAMSRSSVPRGG